MVIFTEPGGNYALLAQNVLQSDSAWDRFAFTLDVLRARTRLRAVRRDSGRVDGRRVRRRRGYYYGGGRRSSRSSDRATRSDDTPSSDTKTRVYASLAAPSTSKQTAILKSLVPATMLSTVGSVDDRDQVGEAKLKDSETRLHGLDFGDHPKTQDRGRQAARLRRG